MITLYNQSLLNEGDLLKKYKKLRKQKKKQQEKVGAGSEEEESEKYSDVDWRGNLQAYGGGGVATAMGG